VLQNGKPTIGGCQLADGDYESMNRQPTLHKPGKQVIATLLRHLQKGSERNSDRLSDFPGIYVEAKTPAPAFGGNDQEHLVFIRYSELLRGILDKSAFGAIYLFLVHASSTTCS